MHRRSAVAALSLVGTDVAGAESFVDEGAEPKSKEAPASGVQLCRSTLDEVVEWLVKGAPGATSPQDVVVHMISELRDMGVPIDRAGIFVSTLHPSMAGRGFIWSAGQPLDVRDIPYDELFFGPFATSPIMDVARTKRAIHRPIARASCPRDYGILAELESDGFTDYLAFPLAFTTGETNAVSVATKARGGFTDADLRAFERIMDPLARVTEIFALRRIASTLLSTYVGRDSGERILAGRIQRGDTEMIRSVVWFSDLRGFTSMSASKAADETIAVLNRVFDCQVPAIEKRGGEVLKFIGDGILAIFPIKDERDAGRIVDLAIDAADEAQAALAKLNAADDSSLQVGIALHLGDVAYGNIGSQNRLDFTAIGAAVNVTARLEGLTGKLRRSLLVSGEIASRTRRRASTVGEFELKGVPAAVEVFTVDDPLSAGERVVL